MPENAHALPFDPWHPLPDPPAASYSYSLSMHISPYEFTNWRDEATSWKTTCYLHAGLNPTDTYKIKGPDVLKFLGTVTATNMDHFEVGRIKHGVMVNDEGTVITDGVMLRTAEDEVTTYWMAPMLNFYLDNKAAGELDVTGELVTDRIFLFQIGGPLSLDVVEAATGEDFHDMRHLRFATPRSAVTRCRSAGSAWRGRSPTRCTATSRTPTRSTTSSGRSASPWA